MKEKHNYKRQGRLNKSNGADFEKRVRRNLEEDNWIVSKWMNQIDLENNKLIAAKHKFSGIGRPMSIGTGFPDFVCFKSEGEWFKVIGVESKSNGHLKLIERQRIQWLIKNKIFGKILIAKKTKVKNKIVIEYTEIKN